MASSPTGSPMQLSNQTTHTSVANVRAQGRFVASPKAATACANASDPAQTAITDAVPRRLLTSTPPPMAAGEIKPAASAA